MTVNKDQVWVVPVSKKRAAQKLDARQRDSRP
jgi:hypothetical protein